jgi:hypothetical protein
MIVSPQPPCHKRLKSLNSFSVSLLVTGAVTDFVARSALWVITGSATANFAQPDSFGTASIAATARGMQAGFCACCGGLALDWTKARKPIQALALSVIAAIAAWTIGYHYIGTAVGLPGADIRNGLDAFVIRVVDNGGLILGLWLCPSFYFALHRRDAGNTSGAGASSLII